MILRSPPIRRVSSFLEDEPSPISIRLQEPVWSSSTNLRLLVHCVQLHSLLERETVNVSAAPPLDDICSTRPGVRQLLDHLCDDAELMRLGTSPMPVIESSGLVCMCPLVGHYLGDPDKVYRDDEIPLAKQYLEHVTGLNQLLSVATQLRGDVRAGWLHLTVRCMD